MGSPDFLDPRITAAYTVLFLMLAAASWKMVKRLRGERSGEPELLGVAVIILSIFIQMVMYADTKPIFTGVDMVSVLVDLVLFIGIGAIALNANRIWPLIAAGAQLVGLFSHFSRAVQLNIDPMAYSILKTAPTLIVGLCVIIGFVGHFQRMKQNGYDLDWMDWSQSFGLGPSRG
ncbi:MAG: hypothetical protein ABJ242_01255 [Marinomonas sp.]